MREKDRRFIIFSDGRPPQTRVRIKEIERCLTCKHRLWLERVQEGDKEWEEHVHRTKRLDGECEAMIWPPWDKARRDTIWKRMRDWYRWKKGLD